MAVEISSASSCCSAMSCINSSTLSISLEKKGKSSIESGTFPRDASGFISWVLQRHHTMVIFMRSFPKIHFARKSECYPHLNKTVHVHFTLPLQLGSQHLYTEPSYEEVFFCTTIINNKLLCSLIQHYYIYNMLLEQVQDSHNAVYL